jgi:hypothetical protein
MKKKPHPPPHSWPGDPEPDFDEDEEDGGTLDDLPGVDPRPSRRKRTPKRADKNNSQ